MLYSRSIVLDFTIDLWVTLVYYKTYQYFGNLAEIETTTISCNFENNVEIRSVSIKLKNNSGK